MQRIKPGDLAVVITLGLFAVFLQIHVNLFETPQYHGLRVSFADFLLPFCGVAVFVSLLRKKSLWPIWQKPFGYWAPILLSCVIILAILNFYRIEDTLSIRAGINKGAGWFILMAYLLVGAWFATNRVELIRVYFLRPFLVFLCFITILELVLRFLINNHVIEPFKIMQFLDYPQIAGFMVNRNAFAFLYLSTLAMGSIYLVKGYPLQKIEAWCFKILWALLPLFFYMNESRAAFLIIIPLVIFMMVENWKLFIKQLLPLMLISLLFFPLKNRDTFSFFIKSYWTIIQGVEFLKGEQDLDEIKNSSDNLRLQIIIDSMALLGQHPISGAGIGSIQNDQINKGQKAVAVLDNTTLWILVEMGPFGLLSFLVVFVVMLVALNRKSQRLDSDQKIFAQACIFLLFSFALFSMLHEITYSRFFWFFLGLGLALPMTQSRPAQAASLRSQENAP